MHLLQAAWRGHVTRQAYLDWQAKLAADRAEQARRLAAAMQTLTEWLPVFLARVKYLRIRYGAR